ncbi:penicillin acylase family protein [Burkholderia sp. Ax-1719]|uniref:penicillin acylase family protein n=1 Tax=Burkholderia sp. Ax-1719 TaxID=2608334 RepID=UPI0014217F8D|nr:penicillin acylase family protein [Burkholderia sp. Ax-1719]NIE64860.1 penicillin acylase family protein [Burkholderia sp. Ax-1719]
MRVQDPKQADRYRTSRAAAVLALLGALVLPGCAPGVKSGAPDAPDVAATRAADIDAIAATPLRATIRRTAYGVPHIEAANWSGLGYGYGYAQASDDLCTLADGFVTWRGERSRYFGPAEHTPTYSTIGRPENLDADFYYRFLVDDAALARYELQQSGEIQALAHGFAAGYDRYVKEIQAGGHAGAHAACRAAPWVKPIDARDVYRRMLAAMYAGGYARFVHAIAHAQPPVPAQVSAQPQALQEAHVPYLQAGGAAGIGSNAIAFGSDATGTPSGLLFGNPHWFWRGPDRFYQAQLTIPGKLDVSGAAFLGAPVVMIGFNRDVAWSLTVSSARRFGLFRLALAPGRPDAYLIDGKPEPMRAERISVETRNADGTTGTVTRTLYRTRFGPLVDLSGLSPALAANAQTAFAIRDINADNTRTFDTFLRWDRADSLEHFMRITRDDASMPWVNTLAVGRNDARAWYADIGAIPDVPEALSAHCTIEPIARALAAKARGVPVLDGSRAACNWADAPIARQPGALPPAAMPGLVRRDYVANMNNSYVFANPAAPLGGYGAIFDSQEGLSLRAQLGLQMIRARLEGQDGFAGRRADSASVRAMTLDSRALSAERFKADVLAAACTGDATSPSPSSSSAETETLAAACNALRRWDNTGNADARGANLWDAFWTHLQAARTGWAYTVPANAADPLNTPRGLTLDAAFARTTLIAAADDLRRAHLAPDSPRGAALYATRAGVRVPLFGGCTGQGYFTAACSQTHVDEPDGLALDGNPNGNSYMQVVSFDADGPQAWTFLTTSLSDDPASPHAGDYTQRYATKSWVKMPYTRAQIEADPALDVTVLDSGH